MNKKKSFIVYGLIDPNDGELRYVGKSSSGITRPRRHLMTCGRRAARGHLNHWLNELYEKDSRIPSILILEHCQNNDDALLAEMRLIRVFREAGIHLTNTTDGGEGAMGYRHTKETRDKIVASLIGRHHSDETKKRISDCNKGKVMSSESIKKMKRWHSGKKLSESHKAAIRKAVKSPEVLAKNRAWHLGRKPSEEARRKMSEAHKGVGLGKSVSSETRNKIRLSRMGMKATPESKNKMRLAHTTPEAIAKARSDHLGKPLSENHRKKIGLGLLGHKHDEQSIEKMRLAALKRWEKVRESKTTNNIGEETKGGQP